MTQHPLRDGFRSPRAGLDGPSRTIIVEPVETPQIEPREEPVPDEAPAAPPEREPEKVPA